MRAVGLAPWQRDGSPGYQKGETPDPGGGLAMKFPVLIEAIEGGRFRARAGEPFGTSADGSTPDEAARQLETLLRGRLQAGARLALIDLDNGPQPPLHLEPLPDEDWFFRTLREAVAENRQRETEPEG